MKEEARKAPHGERAIQLTVNFWTDGIVEGEGNIRPKHAWSFGIIDLRAKKAHGIKSSNLHFDSLAEIPSKIEELLIREGITLHPGAKMAKYIHQEE